MLDWVRRLRKASRKLTLPSRESGEGRGQVQLDVSKLTPDTVSYLAQLSYLQHAAAEIMEDCARFAPNQAIAGSIDALASNQLQRAKAVSTLMAKRGSGSVDEMDRYAARIESFLENIAGKDFYESIMSLYVGFGILDDFYLRLATGLSAQTRISISMILGEEPFNVYAREVLAQSIELDNDLSHRLALFGRSIVADVLLEMSAVIPLEKLGLEQIDDDIELRRATFRKLEPLTSELISDHASRLDQLGMSA